MYPQLKQTLEKFQNNFEGILSERKELLERFAEIISNELKTKHKADLIFICIHNSRRSHLSQFWAQAAAEFYGLNNITCYSGGTEVTAVYPTVISTVKNQGFSVHTIAEGNNPVYSVKYDEAKHSIIGFSKTYDDAFNPQSGFVAVMVCGSADANCPFIPNAEQRISVTFNDPKEFDGTPNEQNGYLERSTLIATEMLYAFSKIKP
ncbi:MAG: protein-tyrosine-phosphatase [Bacteroidia bacterium]